MHITAIETLSFAADTRLMIVRVHTSMGLVGAGETVDKMPGARGALHGTIAPALSTYRSLMKRDV